VHQLEFLAAGRDIRLSSDGRTVLQINDRHPWADGHFGVLGFVRPVKLRNLRMYRAEPETRP
jgi:hypothetical protein